MEASRSGPRAGLRRKISVHSAKMRLRNRRIGCTLPKATSIVQAKIKQANAGRTE